MGNKGNIYKFKPKKNKKNKKSIKKKHLFLSILVIYLICFFSYQGFQIYSLKKQEKQINLKKAELEQQKSIYEKQLEQVNSADYIEKMARQSLRMIMPNEILYVPQEPFLESDDEEELENEEINE